MPVDMTSQQLQGLLKELCSLPAETEWVEFKRNADVEKIGEYISALSNSAALIGKQSAYMVFGVDDDSHQVVGTTFKPSQQNINNKKLKTGYCKSCSQKSTFAFMSFWRVNSKNWPW